MASAMCTTDDASDHAPNISSVRIQPFMRFTSSPPFRRLRAAFSYPYAHVLQEGALRELHPIPHDLERELHQLRLLPRRNAQVLRIAAQHVGHLLGRENSLGQLTRSAIVFFLMLTPPLCSAAPALP